MSVTVSQTREFRTSLGHSVAGLVAIACGVLSAYAAPPLEPLPTPLFSFDLASPTVQAGIVGAADLLAPGSGGEIIPVIVVPGFDLGLLSPLDDLDGLSFRKLPPPGTSISLLFSVDRATVGTLPPDPELLLAGVPFNVQDQAMRQQAAGDEYMSLETMLVGSTARSAGSRSTNNVLVRNNFDEGGTSFTAQPATSAQDNNGSGAPQDNTDSASAPSPGPDGVTVVDVYFSVTQNSPSLQILPGHEFPSGANLFYNADPLGGFPTELYAAFYQLGLVQQDDIDAMIVFDGGQVGVYDQGDIVLFSLTPSSPSLGTLPGHSLEGAAADVYIARLGAPPTIFMPANVLGLGTPTDNIDALDFFPCDDGFSCALAHGIRSNRGDLNCDGQVNFDDINPFVLALSDPTGYSNTFPWCNFYNADCNCDTLVNFDDINSFVACLSDRCPCP